MSGEQVVTVPMAERSERAHELMRSATALLNASGGSARWQVFAVDGSRDAAVMLRNDQAALALMWGDTSVTVLRDDGNWTEHGLPHITPLQRRLMVARLRYAADLLEHGPEGVNP